MARPVLEKVIYVATKNPGGLYISEDEGATFTQVTSNILTGEIQDIAISDRKNADIVISYGNGLSTSVYRSSDAGSTFIAGQNTFGKEVKFVNNFGFVFGGLKTITGSGSKIGISLNNGGTISSTIDVTTVFDYPGAVYNNITITGFDFPNIVGGYITIAGDQNNSSADQILTRTFDRGISFPDALILPGNMGIIRDVWVSPDRNIVFAIGEPDTLRGVLYSINPSLTEAPVKVLDGITIGSITNNLSVKFASVPTVYDDPNPAQGVNPQAGSIPSRSRVYFLDSAGKLYYSSDYGFTWTFKSTIPCQPVDMVVISENIIIVLSKSPIGVYKSVDGGETFVYNPQLSWVTPVGMSSASVGTCENCPEQYEIISGNLPLRCVKDSFTGPLCKSPYQYSTVFEACARPSTIVPTNLVLSLDYSGSIGSLERLLYRQYIKLLISKLEDRLLDGSMKIAIIGWSDTACIQQSFTSDINDLIATVDTDPPGDCFFKNTNHTPGMCQGIRLLYEESVARPNAENVMIIFTDGGHSGPGNPPYPPGSAVEACDLSDIGLLPVVPGTSSFYSAGASFNTSMYPLLKNAKVQLNNNKGMQVMMVTLGTPRERFNTLNWAINEPLGVGGPGFPVPTFYAPSGNYFYFDAGTFDTAEFVADQLRLGLAAEIISSAPCPSGTVGIAGQDNLGYCNAKETFSLPFCTVILTDCAGQIPPFEVQFTTPSANGRLRTIIRLIEPTPENVGNPDQYIYYPGCFFVDYPPFVNEDPSGLKKVIYEDEIFTRCEDCTGIPEPNYYSLTNCDNPLQILYTIEDLSSYISANTPVVTNSVYPGCWRIDPVPADIYTLVDDFATGIDLVLAGCGLCPRAAIRYKLTDYCNDPNNFIYTEDDVLAYLGQVVKLDISATTCWTVELTADDPPIIQPVVITASFADCIECNPPQIYEFVNCEEENSKLSTTNDFSQYDGQVVRLQEYPGNCWTCNAVAASAAPREQLTIDGEPFAGCPECLTTYYQLTNCVNPDVFLISSSLELSRYLGRTITAAGFPSLCFTVTQPKCDCVRIIVNDIQYDVNKAPTIYNGRTLYLFESESGDSLGLAWNNNPNRWELFNTQTLEAYGFNTRDTECPFSNFWTIQQGSPYIITEVSFCAERIYNIAPELDFDNCDPCIKCI